MLSNITVHAIEQFIRRYEPNKTSEEAEEELDALLRTSKSVGKTRSGQSIVVSGHRPEVRMVLKERNVCVTVLPPGSLNAALSEYEQELIEEASTYLASRAEEERLTLEQRISDIKAEMVELEQEVNSLTEQRWALGQQKNDVLAQIHHLKSELKKALKSREMDVP